jgi:K+-sensing histidine kinase KdpD
LSNVIAGEWLSGTNQIERRRFEHQGARGVEPDGELLWILEALFVNLRLKAQTGRALEYLLVVAASCTVIIVRYLLHPWLQTDAPLFILILAPMLSSLYGARPGLLSTAICLLAGWFLFLAPFNSFYLQGIADLARMVVFAIAGCVLSVLGEFRRNAQSSVEVSRQRQ